MIGRITKEERTMHILIAYSTTEGQSAKIAQFTADKLARKGHETTVLNLGETRNMPDLTAVQSVILVGSVHERRHSPALETFMQARRAWLSSRPVMLISVSLSAAFKHGREEAEEYVIETQMRTGFTPDEVVLAEGAVKPNSYDYFAKSVVRFVVLNDREFEMGTNDREFTDWEVLTDRLEGFAATSLGRTAHA